MLSLIKRHISLKYVLATAGTTFFIFGLVFLFVSRSLENHIMEQVQKQAVILHKQIVLTRQWVSDQNHILVRKTEGRDSDPFLQDPDVTDTRGRTYTKITPSIITRELSGYAMNSGAYSFNITNMDGLNPANKPNDFEAMAIGLFRTGKAPDVTRIEKRNGITVFRYAAPLKVTQSCLSCHGKQDLEPGDVGGCISVYIPMDRAEEAIRRNNLLLFSTLAALAVCVVVLLFFSAKALVFRRIEAIRTLTGGIGPEELRSIKGDEIKELALHFQAMDSRLRNQHEELEIKIAEATRDLSSTNRKLQKANEELSLLNKAKQEVFTEFSHELRTPLTSIKGAVDILERKASCNDSSYLEIIKRNTEFLIKTMLDLLDYSRIETGRLELEIRSDSLISTVREAMDSRFSEALENGIDLMLEAEDPLDCSFDRQRVFQIMTNLLSNALRYSPKNKPVLVKLVHKDSHVEVSVQDHGPGIPPEFREVVFEKYWQAPPHKNGSLRKKGTFGVGLAICKGLVEAHGGRIWVESTGEAGCRFCFTLPKGDPS